MARAKVFAARMNDRANRFEERVREKVNKLALAVQRELIMNTPVDTGAAISNWTLALDGPSVHPYSPYAPGSHGSTRQLNIGKAYAQAMAAISDRRPGQTIFISNSLNYITKLNNGSSRQAPSGFVQTAVMVGTSSVRGVKVIT